jgi:hypothetical protein
MRAAGQVRAMTDTEIALRRECRGCGEGRVLACTDAMSDLGQTPQNWSFWAICGLPRTTDII